MISKILMCTAVVAATVAVILLSVLRPGGQTHRDHHPQEPKPIHQPNNNVLSLYIQPGPDGVNSTAESNIIPSARQIIVFDQPVTEAPHNTSPVVGRAQGFMLSSAFIVLDLNLNSSEYNGSLSIRGQQMKTLHADDDRDLHDHDNSSRREEFAVVGGTGHFAFSIGFAVFNSLNVNPTTRTGGAASKPVYHVKLHLALRR